MKQFARQRSNARSYSPFIVKLDCLPMRTQIEDDAGPAHDIKGDEPCAERLLAAHYIDRIDLFCLGIRRATAHPRYKKDRQLRYVLETVPLRGGRYLVESCRRSNVRYFRQAKRRTYHPRGCNVCRTALIG